MKITKSTLRRLIKEEMESILAEEDKDSYLGPLSNKKDLRGGVAKYVKEAEKEVQKANLYLKNAKMEGKSLKFISKMIMGAYLSAAEAGTALKYAYRSASAMVRRSAAASTSKRR